MKTSFYQPFPSETEQAINNWVQALGKVKQNDMGLVKKKGVGGVFVKLLMEKELISDVILAPDGVQYDRKQQKKEKQVLKNKQNLTIGPLRSNKIKCDIM